MIAVVVDATLDERARERLRTIAAFVRRRRGLVAGEPPSVAGANAGR